MKAIRHILLGWVMGLMTGYLSSPMTGFFVAVLVGFFIGCATTIVGLLAECAFARRNNSQNQSSGSNPPA